MVLQRASGGAFIDGLLSGAERKTGWMLAEETGLDRPYRIQSLLGRNKWSADSLRERVYSYVMAALGDRDGVLVVDETGFLKKGMQSVGVARQYSGTVGRIENSQIGVFLGYASRYGPALIDRRLYLPKSWSEDMDRRRKASMPDEVAFATKPATARDMITTALDAAPCAWVLADALYDSDYKLRRVLEDPGASPMSWRCDPDGAGQPRGGVGKRGLACSLGRGRRQRTEVVSLGTPPRQLDHAGRF
ncbi:IS701 family transposase [Tistrella mobilis]